MSGLSLSASDIRSFQTCKRRWLLERHWRVVRWRPSYLFRSCLREGIFQLSNAGETATVRANARTRFLTEAARPGLDVLTGDPWTVAQDWAGMLGVTLTALSRLVLLTLQRSQPIDISPLVSWLPLSWQDDSGTLHRWLTVDAWDDDALVREAHSWHVLGDMVMLDAPMMLHAIEIGQQRGGRRHSPWARCYKHPVIAGTFRFQRPDGKGGWRKLSGEQWKPLWYADQTKPDPEAWCDLMDADHVTQSLLHHISIQQPSRSQSQRIRKEIEQVAGAMTESLASHPTAESPMEVAMARGACDPVWGPCAWQQACYGADYTREGIQGTGLYQIREARADESSSRPRPSHRDSVASVGA